MMIFIHAKYYGRYVKSFSQFDIKFCDILPDTIVPVVGWILTNSVSVI